MYAVEFESYLLRPDFALAGGLFGTILWGFFSTLVLGARNVDGGDKKTQYNWCPCICPQRVSIMEHGIALVEHAPHVRSQGTKHKTT